MPTLTPSSTWTFKLTATRDGVAWNLTGATVNFYLRKPDGTLLTKTATVTDAAGGIAEYTALTTDLDVSGSWTRAWQVTSGATVLRSNPIPFVVAASP